MKNVQQAHLRSGIAGKIRALRWDRHWTQVELARKLGLSQGRYSEIERGQGSFTAEQFLEILKLFNVPVSHFTKPQKGDGPETPIAPARMGAGHLHESPDVFPEDLPKASDVSHVGILKAVQPPGPQSRKSVTKKALPEDHPADLSGSSGHVPARSTGRSLSNSLEMDWD